MTAKLFPPGQGSQFSATDSVRLLPAVRTGHCNVPVWLVWPLLPRFSCPYSSASHGMSHHGAAALGRCLPGIHLRRYWSVESLPTFSQNHLAPMWPDSMAGSPASIAAAWKICPVDVSWASHWLPAITLLAGYKVPVVRVTRICLWWHWHKLPTVSCQERKRMPKSDALWRTN